MSWCAAACTWSRCFRTCPAPCGRPSSAPTTAPPGRTAGILLGRAPAARRARPLRACCRRPPATPPRSTARIGFAQVLEERFPACAAAASCSTCRNRKTRPRFCARKSWTRRRPTGSCTPLYNVGPGSHGVSRALQEFGYDSSLGFAVHDLLEVHRSMLVADAAPYVLHQDVHYAVMTAAARAAAAVRRSARRPGREQPAASRSSLRRTWHDRRPCGDHNRPNTRTRAAMKKFTNSRATSCTKACWGSVAAHAQLVAVHDGPAFVMRRSPNPAGGADLRRRLGPRAPAYRLRGRGHARCRLPGPGVHLAFARPDARRGQGCRQRGRRALHRQELRRRRDELPDGHAT